MSSVAVPSSKTEKRRPAEYTKKLENSVLQFVLELDDQDQISSKKTSQLDEEPLNWG